MSRRDAFAAGHGRPEFHADPFSMTEDQLHRFFISWNDAKVFNGGGPVNQALTNPEEMELSNPKRKHPGRAIADAVSFTRRTDEQYPYEAVARDSVIPDQYPGQETPEHKQLRAELNRLDWHGLIDTRVDPSARSPHDQANLEHVDLISSMAAEGKHAGVLSLPMASEGPYIVPVVNVFKRQPGRHNPKSQDEEEWDSRASRAQAAGLAQASGSDWKHDPDYTPTVFDPITAGGFMSMHDYSKIQDLGTPGVRLRGPHDMKRIWDTISRAQIGTILQGRVR